MLSLSLCHHQSDIVSCYGNRYEKRYVNDGDKRYRNDATTIDCFLPGGDRLAWSLNVLI